MANDPPTTPTPVGPIPSDEDVAKQVALAEATTKSATGFEAFSSAAGIAKGALSALDSKFAAAGVSLKNYNSMTSAQIATFGALSASIVGVRKSFDGLSNIDANGLETFSGQWKDLTEMMSNSPIKQEVIDKVKRFFSGHGISDNKINEAAKSGAKGLGALGAAFFESADNGLRLQNAMVQLAAKTGNLDNIFKAAGPNLQNINLLLQDQQKSLTATAGATGLNAKTVEQYYSQLGAVPGALQATVKSSNMAGDSTSMLTASIQLAKGSGRAYADVIEDLKVAFNDYNIKGEAALRFTAQMGELSNKFGIELSEVKGALKSTADMFKMFGNESEGAAKMMNNYLGALEKTGISGKVALDVMAGLTSGIKGMSLAQKGFLSAQTGGPGGLVGGFQIEKMLREGKMDDVMEKVRQQMKKQMGSIVTLDDAAKSPQAAAQMTKQMMILQQGPLGKFAKDDQSAMRILEAFKTRDQGGAVGDLSKSIVQDTMKTGVDLQEKSVTELTRIRELLQGNQGFASMANLTTAQHGATAGVGTALEGGDYNREYRNNLKEKGARASRRSGASTQEFGDGVNRLNTMGKEQAEGFAELYKEMGPALKAPINKIKDLLKSGKSDEAAKVYSGYLEATEKRKKELANQPSLVRAQGLENVSRDEASMKSAWATLSASGGTVGDKGLPMPPDMSLQASAVGGASGVVNQAANRATTGIGKPGTASSSTGDKTDSSPGHITVQVEGMCINCGTKMNNDRSRASFSKGSEIDK